MTRAEQIAALEAEAERWNKRLVKELEESLWGDTTIPAAIPAVGRHALLPPGEDGEKIGP